MNIIHFYSPLSLPPLSTLVESSVESDHHTLNVFQFSASD